VITALIIAFALLGLTVTLAVAFFVIGLTLELIVVDIYTWLRKRTFR
jgi:hypothetical protein